MTDKVRARTIQQKLGFADNDLKTSKHDEIMLWLDKHIEEVVQTIVGEGVNVLSQSWETPVMSGKYMVGFIDMFVLTSGYKWRFERSGICFEVKTTIPSLGELIRQIMMYQGHMGKSGEFAKFGHPIFVVVSPDARYADVLRSQGIEFYHYNPDPYEEAMNE